MTAAPSTFRFVSSNRRVREDRRFVAGQGRYVADVALEGMLHVAVLPSQHPAAAHRLDRCLRRAGDAGRALRADRR